MPCTAAPTIVPASSGSSPAYSKLRPLRGSRSRFTPPASSTLKPSLCASLPIMAPPARAISGSKLAATAMPEGNAVAPLPCACCNATPWPASVSWIAGRPSSGIGRNERGVMLAAGRRWLAVVHGETVVGTEQPKFLFRRHRLDQGAGALLGRQRWIQPRLVFGCGSASHTDANRGHSQRKHSESTDQLLATGALYGHRYGSLRDFRSLSMCKKARQHKSGRLWNACRSRHVPPYCRR